MPSSPSLHAESNTSLRHVEGFTRCVCFPVFFFEQRIQQSSLRSSKVHFLKSYLVIKRKIEKEVRDPLLFIVESISEGPGNPDGCSHSSPRFPSSHPGRNLSLCMAFTRSVIFVRPVIPVAVKTRPLHVYSGQQPVAVET